MQLGLSDLGNALWYYEADFKYEQFWLHSILVLAGFDSKQFCLNDTSLPSHMSSRFINIYLYNDNPWVIFERLY